MRELLAGHHEHVVIKVLGLMVGPLPAISGAALLAGGKGVAQSENVSHHLVIRLKLL
ncbi:hypothetical protein D3C71_2247390 [compost metagenome]